MKSQCSKDEVIKVTLFLNIKYDLFSVGLITEKYTYILIRRRMVSVLLDSLHGVAFGYKFEGLWKSV